MPTQQPVATPLQTLGRFGFFARGLVYLVVGWAAARVTILQRGKETGPAGALEMILNASFGRTMLAVIAAGFLSFAVFRLAQAIKVKTGIRRVVPVAGAVAALVLAGTSLRLLLHLHRHRDGSAALEWGRRVLRHPWGPALLAAGGVVAMIVGAVRIGRGLLGKLPSDYTNAIIARQRKPWVQRLARAGLLAHGIVVATVGYAVLRAGLGADSRGLVDTAGALHKIRFVQGGPALFALVAVGLVAHGVSLLVLAVHRRRRT